jgi:hypothetical protein
VTIAGGGGAIPEARVAATGPGVRETTTADREGRFTLGPLAAGTYRITVEKESFAFDNAAPLVIAVAARAVGPVTIEMHPAGAIVGAVHDERGNPRSGVSVTAVRKTSGGTALARRPPVTNDLGEFRADGLLPGEYLVLASPPGARIRTEALMPTYYPATIDKEAAATVTVAPGGTTANIFITMASAPAFEVSGVVVDEAGRPLPRVIVSFVHRAIQGSAYGQAQMQASVQALTTRPDGTFSISGLGPGTYRLTPTPAPANGARPPSMDLVTWAVNGNASTVNVDVRDADVSGVTIVMRAPR